MALVISSFDVTIINAGARTGTLSYFHDKETRLIALYASSPSLRA
jgi:hypothetical protein